MLDEERSRRLIMLLADETSIAADKFTDQASFFHDLGVAGVDGADLLEAVGCEFQIDLSDVSWWKYFGAEAPYKLVYHIFCFLRGKKLDHDIVRLEVSDVKRTIEAGAWQEPKSA